MCGAWRAAAFSTAISLKRAPRVTEIRSSFADRSYSYASNVLTLQYLDNEIEK